jgi:hypothetical protein
MPDGFEEYVAKGSNPVSNIGIVRAVAVSRARQWEVVWVM